MLFIFEGILVGLTLAMLIGPIFITLTQISMQNGIRAGLTAGIGIWISDVIVIALAWWSIQKISHWLQNPSFLFWQSLIGGIIIIAVGIFSILNRNKAQIKHTNGSFKNYLSYFNRGFIVNFVNPFTFVFWITMLSSRALNPELKTGDLVLFFGSILITIILTDTLKIVLAKKISKKLSTYHISIIQLIASFTLVIFGIVIIIQTF